MASLPRLPCSRPSSFNQFTTPVKCIHDGPDVQFFQQSLAYRDIMTFILQLNRSLIPRKRKSDGTIKDFRLDSMEESDLLPQIVSMRAVLTKLQRLIEDAPPDTGPRRFGNVSFKKWYQFVENQIDALLSEALPEDLQLAVVEVKFYLLGSFGSPQRLDYGTGHELSFLAFIVCLWKLGYFAETTPIPNSEDSNEIPDVKSNVERQIVLALFSPYLTLVHTLITTYNLEPAGSHGVWGLDDNSFLPYVFGSAQLSDPLPIPDLDPPTPTPTSGSLPSSPDPSIVTKPDLVSKEIKHNLYFVAINFIHTVKRGPFWEHSPMLFDISGIKDGWGKINKGMIKMYQAEVLAKFPVVQHFVFGSLLKWERDPEAKDIAQTTHLSSQPLRDPAAVSGGNVTTMRPPGGGGIGTAAPWATGAGTRTAAAPAGFVNGVTQAPWARGTTTGAELRAGTATGRIPLSGGRSALPSRTPIGTSQLRRPDIRPGSISASQNTQATRPSADSIPEERRKEDT